MAKKLGKHYFPHDFGARNDPKLVNVLMDHGVAGIGAYWCIIEALYEEGGELPLSACRHIAFALHCDTALVQNVIEGFGLFENDGERFWSEAVNARIDKREELAQKRRDAIAKRWGSKEGENTIVSNNNTNVSNNDTIVLETDTNVIQKNTNKIKQNKIKQNEIKLNKSCCYLIEEKQKKKQKQHAAEGDEQQQRYNIEKLFFVEKRCIKAATIAERFWNLNGAFGWKSKKAGKDVNPIYAARLWKPAPDELGGHACTDTALAGAYFDFAKGVEHMHPDAGKLLTEFNNIEVNDGATTITFNDGIAGDILDTILLNNQETAYKAFKARFGVKTVSYITTE